MSAIEGEPASTAAPEPDARSLDALAAGVFVGRRKELETLRTALEEVLSGHGRMITLVGEPGIGKTRTATEFTTYARLRRCQVLWGRCYEAAGAPPYWPFVQALRGYVRERDADQLRRELGSVAAALAEILPELNTKLPGLAPLPAAEPAQARFRLFDSITAFLRAASADQPILLVLDDLHWADGGTLALLEFLARELEGARLLVLGTYRDVELTKGHPLAATLAELTRERLYERVLLRGLDQDDVGRFIAGTAGITPPEALVTAVYRHTEGNPLFVTEVVRLLVQEGALNAERLGEREQWSVRIPDGVREVIGKRLERLTDRCQDVLRTAAVLGREFSIEQLAALTDDLGEDRLLGVLEEALAARVIEDLPRSVGRFAFTHALIQDTLTGALSATRRARLHARIGETLERLYGDRADARAAELAYHFDEARAVMGTERFVIYGLLAGEQALAAHAFEEAIDRFEAVVAAKAGGPTDAESAAALLGLGRAKGGTARWADAVPPLVAAFDWYAAAGDTERLVVAATSLSQSHSFGLPPEARALVPRALRIVPPDSIAAGRLLTMDGWFIALDDGDYDRGARAIEQALEIARRHGDRLLEEQVLGSWARVDSWHARWQACLDHGNAAIELARSIGDEDGELLARLWVIRGLTSLGDYAKARMSAAAGLALADRRRGSLGLQRATAEYANVLTIVGEWGAARELVERSLTLDPHSGYADLGAVLELQVGNVEAAVMHIDQLEEAARVAPNSRQNFGGLVPTAAFMDYCVGAEDRLDVAVERARRAFGATTVPLEAISFHGGLVLIAARRGDARMAEESYEGLLGYAGQMWPYYPFAIDHLLALAARTMGRGNAAIEHFEKALAFVARTGYRPAYGFAAADAGAFLLERDAPGDHARGTALQNEALEIGRELGMRPLMERVLARREFLKA